MKRFYALSLTLAFALGFVAVGIARADAPAHFNVTLWNSRTADYPVTGSMDLRYHSDGTVTGYYHPASLPSFIPITGGRNGDHIWLTVGTSGGWQFDGHFRDGKIVGSATEEHPGVRTLYSFTATPS